MYCYDEKDKFEECIARFIAIVRMSEIISHLHYYSNIDPDHWQEVVLKLLNRETHDVQFAEDIAENIIRAYANKDYDYQLNLLLKPIIAVLLARYKDTTWNIFSRALLDGDSIVQHRILSLFKPESDLEDETSSIISHLPNEFLIDWCDRNPQKGPHILCEIIPIIIKEAVWKFHPVIQSLIDTYGDCEDLLRSIYRNMQPSSWTGSITPYYERQINVLNTLSVHSNYKVREWAKGIIGHLRDRIQKEKQREDEYDAFGIY